MPMAQDGLGVRLEGAATGGGGVGQGAVSMFVCAAVRFHTNGRLVSAGLRSTSYPAPNIPQANGHFLSLSLVLTSYMLLLNRVQA